MFKFMEEDLELRIVSLKTTIEDLNSDTIEAVRSLRRRMHKRNSHFTKSIQSFESMKNTKLVEVGLFAAQRVCSYPNKAAKCFDCLKETIKSIANNTSYFNSVNIGKFRSKWIAYAQINTEKIFQMNNIVVNSICTK
jgi:hypothetical protein